MGGLLHGVMHAEPFAEDSEDECRIRRAMKEGKIRRDKHLK